MKIRAAAGLKFIHPEIAATLAGATAAGAPLSKGKVIENAAEISDTQKGKVKGKVK